MSGPAGEPTGAIDIAHLREHRGTVAAYAVLVGLSGALPIPGIDDYLGEQARAALVRKLASARGLTVDAKVARLLAQQGETPAWRRVAVATGFLAAMRRRFRKLFFAALVAERADEIARAFVLGTLLDHYFARHRAVPPEGGGAMAADEATRVRAAIEVAAGGVRRELTRKAVERAGGRLGGTAERVPEVLAAVLRRARGGGRGAFVDAEVGEPVAPEVETAAAHRSIVDAAEALAREVSAGGGRLLAALVAAFEAALSEAC